MSTPEKIVLGDGEISQILDSSPNAAHDLFEAYRTRYSKDEFVAALIARLCLLEAQKRLGR